MRSTAVIVLALLGFILVVMALSAVRLLTS